MELKVTRKIILLNAIACFSFQCKSHETEDTAILEVDTNRNRASHEKFSNCLNSMNKENQDGKSNFWRLSSKDQYKIFLKKSPKRLSWIFYSLVSKAVEILAI